MDKEEHLYSHPRTMKELTVWYGVDRRTIKGWLIRKGLDSLVVGRRVRYFTIDELRKIAEAIGE